VTFVAVLLVVVEIIKGAAGRTQRTDEVTTPVTA
jgi:hypothetical protein